MSAFAPADLVITRISTGYPRRPVICELTLPPIKSGEVTALAGPNGAGKSTLLRALAGLLKATGTVHFGEIEILSLSLSERSRHISFMPQTLPQRVSLTIIETVINALRLSPEKFGASTKEIYGQAMAVLQRVGLQDLALESLNRLSGGQRQLASLAQALVREPKILLLDEPTSSLDLRHQAIVVNLTQEFASEGRIVIVVLHDLGLAARWAENIVLLQKGTLRASGIPGRAITPQVLADVYGVDARVETCSRGRLQIIVDRPLP